MIFNTQNIILFRVLQLAGYLQTDASGVISSCVQIKEYIKVYFILISDQECGQAGDYFLEVCKVWQGLEGVRPLIIYNAIFSTPSCRLAGL